VRLVICGVRGSTPSPGPEFVRYGGNTSCIAIVPDSGPDGPLLVLDAGTGLARLSRFLDGRPFRGTLLLGHLHWDHTHGLPFFPAGNRPDSRVQVLIPQQGDTAQTLARAMSPPHFPITPSQLLGDWTFEGIEEGRHEIEGFSVVAREIPHKGGRCFGYRVDDGASTIAYLSDHSPINFGPGPEGMGEYHRNALELAAGVDLLIHDAQYTRADFGPRAHYGHSTVEYAVGLAERAGARRLLLFHHDPPRTDAEIDAIVAGLRNGRVPVEAAAEGMTIDLPAPEG
jgi:phosphoribosyl 1,2-cyclic phosphodiesterase